MSTHVSSLTYVLPSLWSASERPIQAGAQSLHRSMGPRDVHVKRLHHGPHAAGGFAPPERLTQNGEPALFGFANHTKNIARVGGLIGGQNPFGEVPLQRRIGGQNGLTSAPTERFAFEPPD